MLPRDELIKRAENKEEISRVIDKAEQAIKNWEVVVTDFLLASRSDRSTVTLSKPDRS